MRGRRVRAHPLLQRSDLADGGAVRASIGLGIGDEGRRSAAGRAVRADRHQARLDDAAVDGYVSPVPDPRPPASELLGPAAVPASPTASA